MSGCGGTSNSLGQLTGNPSISSITPNPVAPGATITIAGANLNGTLTTAYFQGANTAQSTASSGSTTSVTVTVPTSLPAGSYSVYVITTDTSGDVSSPSASVTISVT
jgi:hypothetical protein